MSTINSYPHTCTHTLPAPAAANHGEPAEPAERRRVAQLGVQHADGALHGVCGPCRHGCLARNDRGRARQLQRGLFVRARHRVRVGSVRSKPVDSLRGHVCSSDHPRLLRLDQIAKGRLRGCGGPGSAAARALNPERR
eukprot:363269-Chlamydomonas_euryale.AAC.10